MVRTCCVPGCKSGNKAPRHQFPKNPLRCQQWINSLNLDFLKDMCANDLSKYTVCYKHFCEQDYSCSRQRRLLVDTAIPVHRNHLDNNSDMVNLNIMINEQQALHVLEESEHTDNPLSDHMDLTISQVKQQVQHHNQQLMVQQKTIQHNSQQLQHHSQLLETIDTIETQQMENINEIKEGLERMEKQFQILLKKKKVSRRPNLQQITRTRNLTPTSRMLYNTVVSLRRANTRLKRVDQRKIKQRRTKATLLNDVQQQFINMLARNSDIHPKVHNSNST